MESRVKDGNYVTIQSWMVKDLNLKGNELLVYAIIYMFSQDGDGKFNGSLQYLADWTNSSKRSVMNNLQSLIQKDLIVKEEQIMQGVKKVQYYGKKFTGVVKKVQWGIEKSSPNNKEDIKDNNKVIKKEIIKEKNELPFINQETKDSYQIYKDMRAKMRKPIYDDMKVFEKLMQLSNGNENLMKEILDQSIVNGWQGLFQLKEEKPQKNDDWRLKYYDQN